MYRLVFAVLAVMAAPTGAAQATDNPPAQNTWGDARTHYAWADVLKVEPIYGMVARPQADQACRDPHRARLDDEPNAAALATDMVGGESSDPSDGAGMPAASVDTAVHPGADTDRHDVGIGGASQRLEVTLEPRASCQRVTQVYEERRIDGYDVEYRYRGEIYMSRLEYDPGQRLRIRVSVSPVD